MEDLLPELFDQFPDDIQWIPVQWADYGGKTQFSGRIQTLRCFRDNSKVRELLATPGEGRVLLVDGGGDLNRALLGDQLAEKAVANGWGGVVVYGAVRDAAAISHMSLGVKALGVCPIKTEKKGEGEVGVLLHIDGVRISPDDYLYADRNGIAVSANHLVLS